MTAPAVRDRGRSQYRPSSLPSPVIQRTAEHLHALGSRAIGELLAELIARHGIEVLTAAEAYRRVDPSILRAVGADRWPPRMVAIDGGAR